MTKSAQDMGRTQELQTEAERRAVIRVVRLLGYGGLVPFVVLAGAVMLGLRTPFAPAQSYLIGYGAVILSFVGALHWGDQLSRAVPSALRFIWSVVPALGAWVALMMPDIIGAIILIAGLASCLLFDLPVMRKGQWPSYMMVMRIVLTIIACLCLSVIFLR